MSPQPAFDPGLTQKFTGKLRRAINKDGSFNVKRHGGGSASRNLYLALINLSWAKFNALVVGAYLVLNIVFAFLYMSLGPNALSETPTGSGSEQFLAAFFFSAQTLTTVGYGRIAPLSIAASAWASIEAMVGLLGFALATGLMYGRIARPSARLLFSPSLLVAPFQGGTSLQFRVANQRSNVLMDLQITVLLMTVEAPDGERKRQYAELALERTRVNFIPLTWTVVHPIVESSPLFGKTLQDLEQSQAELLILLRAFDDTFSQTVHARHSYRHEEVKWGARFLPAFSFDADGDMHLDLRKIDDFELTPLPSPT